MPLLIVGILISRSCNVINETHMLLRCIYYLDSRNSDGNARRYLGNVGNEDIIKRWNEFVDEDSEITRHETEQKEKEKKKKKKNMRSPTAAQKQVFRYIQEFTKEQESHLRDCLVRVMNNEDMDSSERSSSEESDAVLEND